MSVENALFMALMAFILMALCASLCLEVRGAIPEVAPPLPKVTPAPPPSAPAKRSAAELEKLAIPIALHPDPLISVILPASVYPVEIVMAARFLRDTNNLSKVDAQPWDDSIKAVAKFPELIAKMDADLDWTVALGQAFLDQRQELMDTIQALRRKAQEAGTLKTTEQQVVIVTNAVLERVVQERVVVVTNTIVEIQPSNPEVIYIPSYPATVYYPPPVYAYGSPYYWYGYYPYAPLMTFSAGVFWGAAFSHWHHCDWGHGDIDIDVNRNVNINRGDRNFNRGGGGQRWQADSGRLQRAGAGGTRPSQRPSFGSGAQRPSQQPARGGVQRPSQQPSLGGGQRPSQRPVGGGTQRPAQQPSAGGVQRPSQQPGASQRPSAAQRPTSSSQRSGAFSGMNSGGGNTRNYSNRGSYSRGGGGFSGGRGGGGRGGGGRRR